MVSIVYITCCHSTPSAFFSTSRKDVTSQKKTPKNIREENETRMQSYNYLMGLC